MSVTVDDEHFIPGGGGGGDGVKKVSDIMMRNFNLSLPSAIRNRCHFFLPAHA